MDDKQAPAFKLIFERSNEPIEHFFLRKSQMMAEPSSGRAIVLGQEAGRHHGERQHGQQQRLDEEERRAMNQPAEGGGPGAGALGVWAEELRRQWWLPLEQEGNVCSGIRCGSIC